MTDERLNELKLRAARAESLAKRIEELNAAETEGDRCNLDFADRCETYRLGREALLAKLTAELEGILGHSPPPASAVERFVLTNGPFAVMSGAPWNVLDCTGCRIACCGGDSPAEYERFGPAIAAAIVAALNERT